MFVLRHKRLSVRRLLVSIYSLALLVTLVCCRLSHDQEHWCSARADAEKAGEFDRGWLPEFLPSSSHAIHVAEDNSPSRVWCAFQFDPTEVDKLLDRLKPVDPSMLPISRVPNPHVQWWPQSLEGKIEVQKIQGAGLALYSVTRAVTQDRNETTLFALDRANGRGYFYGQ
jgi:hypothetical protein